MGYGGHVTNSVLGYRFFSPYKKNQYFYENSRYNRPVSIIFYSFRKISRRYFILRGNVVTEL